ncbi:MAG: cytochrome b [Pseudomonas sp.]|uniref:cytochrome b n=1 Tax=Halopseudomonas laoshanensis TaxID=2268758 RepID=UPI001B48BC0E|nr:cytochrome b [Pseudomonas sp.]MBQ0777185.1 cytochrome b [Pseudomonas sp.]WOD13253.1 cytochrome b [Pseudomonas sp. NyZ704]
MKYMKTPTRYHGLSIALHWLMLILIAAVFACMELKGNFPKGSGIREGLKLWHFGLGISVLMLVCIRLLTRLLTTNPADPNDMSPQWQKLAATAMHLALYAWMIAMPLLGWLILSAEGKHVAFLGYPLPWLMQPSETWAERFEQAHEWGALAGYWMIGLHALAGIAHHYLWRDGTLLRMLPRRSNAPPV